MTELTERTERLEVHLYGRHVADVHDNGDGLCTLQYTPTAVSVGAPARLSLALPPRPEPYPSLRGAQRWVEALLPEGHAREVLVAEFQVPAHDTFALLSVVGRDVAGAAVIVGEGEDPGIPDATYARLTQDELEGLVADVGRRPFALDRERGVRLSLAGVQNKLALHRPHRSRSLYLPLHGAASTLIVKPEPVRSDPRDPDLTGLVTNELFGLTLAQHTRLEVAEAYARTIGGRPCLIVERYDRDRRVDPPVRIHQEDLLTAMGRDHRLKYEAPVDIEVAPAGGFAARRPIRSEPGPALVDLAALVSSQLGAAGMVRLLEAVTFNIAFGNADAHARNYAIVHPPSGRVRLAPLYDLVCTRLYGEPVDPTAAQRVNGVDHIDEVDREDLVDEASRWGLGREVAANVVTDTLARMQASLEVSTVRTLERGGDEAVVDELRRFVAARLERLV